MTSLTTNRFIIITLALAIIGLGGAFMFGYPVSADKVTIMVPSGSEHVLYAYLWLAKERGYFEQQGIDVEIALSSDEEEVVRSVGLGHHPIGAVAVEHFLAEHGAIPSIIPFMFFLYGESETSSYDTHFVASKRSGITSPSGLKGKSIRIGQPPTRIALRNMLADAGLTTDDVKLVTTIASHDVLGALQDGTIDAAVTYYPTMPVILASGDVSIIGKNIFANYVMDNVPQSAIGINKNFAMNNPDTVKRFLKAMEEAFDYGEDHPADVITAYANLKAFGSDDWTIDAELLEKAASLMPRIAVKELDGFYVEDGKKETVFEVLNEYQDVLLEADFIETKADLQPLWDNYAAFKNISS
jgi:NitT/TauT family transport system substrate-binding protein